jgi:hypothetical protein
MADSRVLGARGEHFFFLAPAESILKALKEGLKKLKCNPIFHELIQ